MSEWQEGEVVWQEGDWLVQADHGLFTGEVFNVYKRTKGNHFKNVGHEHNEKGEFVGAEMWSSLEAALRYIEKAKEEKA